MSTDLIFFLSLLGGAVLLGLLFSMILLNPRVTDWLSSRWVNK